MANTYGVKRDIDWQLTQQDLLAFVTIPEKAAPGAHFQLCSLLITTLANPLPIRPYGILSYLIAQFE